MVALPTGETVASRWAGAADNAERREILHEFDVTVKVYPEGSAYRWRPFVGGEDVDTDLSASVDVIRQRRAPEMKAAG